MAPVRPGTGAAGPAVTRAWVVKGGSTAALHFIVTRPPCPSGGETSVLLRPGRFAHFTWRAPPRHEVVQLMRVTLEHVAGGCNRNTCCVAFSDDDIVAYGSAT